MGKTKFLIEGTVWPAGKANKFPAHKAEFYISHQRKIAHCKLFYTEIVLGLVHVSLECNDDLLINMTINPGQEDHKVRYDKLGYNNRLYLLVLFEGILDSITKNSELAMRCLEEFRFSIKVEVDNKAAAFLNTMLFS